MIGLHGTKDKDSSSPQSLSLMQVMTSERKAGGRASGGITSIFCVPGYGQQCRAEEAGHGPVY